MPPPLYQLLIKDGLLTADQAQMAWLEQQRTNERLGTVLARLGLVSDEGLVNFVSRTYGIPVVDPRHAEGVQEAVRRLPRDLVQKYQVFPVRVTDDTLTLALSDPSVVVVLDELQKKIGLRIVPALATETAIKEAIDHYYIEGGTSPGREVGGFLLRELQSVETYRKERRVSLLTVVFSDIVGYTDLCERLNESQVARIRRLFEQLARQHIETRHAGLIVKWIGDAALAVYAEPTSAVLATLGLHADVAKAEVEGQTLRLRSGIHLGQVALEREGLNVDVFGRHVNRAARVQAAAEPGEVLVTDPVADNVRGWIDEAGGPSVRFHRRQTRVLKGIEEPVTVFTAEFADELASVAGPTGLPQAHLILLVREPGRPDRELVFDAERGRRVFVGSAGTCDVQLRSADCTRTHAMLILDNDNRWMVQDLGSSGGTYRNGVRADLAPLPLREGDEIRIGNSKLVVRSLGYFPRPRPR